MRMFFYIVTILFSRKERKYMFENLSILYAQLIIRGKRTFKSVPAKLKPYVKQALIDLDAGELAIEDEAQATPSNAS
ncbi:hypothetical protein HMPREF0381_0061 [Lachnoanaerobaculum saburreum DSM 3986]|uniref:Uncharacterized protein n=2 Tax=Lachnoanaerobaculum saburreum TaxID=467210 RepID=E6LJC6_9FIRM|nr:hypothetical protein HMPREF0381_0061 [Lachnoanaerobaculum saburreum DSM 3986]